MSLRSMFFCAQSVSSMMWPPATPSPIHWLSRIGKSAPPLAANSVKILSCHWVAPTRSPFTVQPLTFANSWPRSFKMRAGCQSNQAKVSVPFWATAGPCVAAGALVAAGAEGGALVAAAAAVGAVVAAAAALVGAAAAAVGAAAAAVGAAAAAVGAVVAAAAALVGAAAAAVGAAAAV